MPQKTNLNISPYYDDFDKTDNFYKVLFKPGFPVQARELTSLQSILQNQVESFGSHMFKEGSMVIPGGISYDSEYYSIKLNSEHLGVPISLYVDKLVGLRLTGQNSGVSIVIDKYLLPSDSTEVSDITFFIKYVSSGNNNDGSSLEDGERLLTETTFAYGNTVFNVGDSVVTLISDNASSVGSAAAISNGVYFIRGTFVDVSADKIVLDPYTNTPSYRVGLSIQEELVTAKDDDGLYDNARGFTNFAAPGSDRLKIALILTKKSINDTSDKTFVELLRLDQGEVKVLNNKPQYNLIRDYFAKRTFEESGDYTVEGFGVQVANSLNDGLSNEGVFKSDQKTDQGIEPTEDLMAVKVSPGKAYVRGFDIDKAGTTILDVEKPRDKGKVDSALVPLALGNKIKVNNVQGTPFIGINNNHTISLSNSRLGSGTITGAPGTVIGQARAYSFSLSDAAYSNDASSWDLYLFDVQTYTQITTNLALSNTELPATSYVEGISSGAFGYAVSQGGGNTSHMLVQTSGTFIKGEPIRINGSIEIPRSIEEVKVFGTQDIKSVYQNTGGSGGIIDTSTVDFAADTVLSRVIPKGFTVADQLVINSAGIASCAGKNFLGIKSDTIIRYQRANTEEVFNKVRHIPADGLTMDLDAVQTVSGVCNGAIPATGQETVTFSIGRPSITNDEDSGLFAPLSNENISDINLSQSTLVVSKQLTGKSTGAAGTFSLYVSDLTGISSAFYENFDEDRYSIHYSDGAIEDLTSDQFTLSTDGTTVNLTGLRTGQNNVVINSTVRKKDIVSKQKNFVRSDKITIDKTVSAASTEAGGLTVNSYYGLRVEDKEISLNVPDVINIVGVFESVDTSAPSFDKLTFISGLSLDTTSILGEKIIGSVSGAIAQITNRTSATQVEIVYLTQTKFNIGETVTFEESNITTNLQNITYGVYQDISDRFTLDKGHKEQYLDYSRIVRSAGFPKPTRKVTVVFNRYDVPSTDNGDIFTVASYDLDRFTKDIPILENNIRASDTLDFRPRVSSLASGITTASPFAFSMRAFGVSGNNPTLVVSPEESSILGYSFYLPRIDKVVLDSLENLSVIKGVSSLDPKEPLNVEAAMTIATIELPAYLYDPDDAKVIMIDNKRFTMRDIGKLEDRIENLETITSLSLLELDTKTLQIQDADGLSRFKTGFFVDDFKDNNLLDIRNPDCKCDVNSETKELETPLDFYSIKPEIALLPTLNSDEVDLSADLELLDSNLKKTGDIVTLDYSETTLLDQPLASRTENVNPFNIVKFDGIVTLNPAADNWTRNVFIQGGERTVTGDTEGTFITEVKSGSRPDDHIRSRNVKFEANGLKPFTRYYPFFDGTSGIDIIPKLVEITMVSGSFQSGETVTSNDNDIICRICQPNHKTGDINSPSTTFANNPYNTSITLPTGYSASATVLNVDIASLAEEAQGRFFGRIENGMTLLGQTSGAIATVSNIRLISDTFGDTIGSFFFRDPLAVPEPPLRFRNGTRTFKLTSSSTNAIALAGTPSISTAETAYRTSGIVDEFVQTTVSIRTPPPPPIPVVINVTNITQEITNVTNITQQTIVENNDPLAQTFTVDETGAFLSSVDLFFAEKDNNEKLHVQVRTTELGTPTNKMVVDYAHVSLEPSQINVSTDASTATTVTFSSPIYLQANLTYAIVLLAPTTNNYLHWIARMGEATVDTQSLPNTESVIITNQYLGGSLFRSQNGSIWTANQFEDMKLKLNKCSFTSTLGTLYLYNPKLGNRNAQTARLLPNSITTLPRKLKVKIDATNNANLTIGRKVSEGATTGPTGIIEQKGASLTSTAITNAGIGYSNGSFAAVPLYNITGNGTDAQATITITNNIVASVSVSANGSGYVKGDILGITTSNVSKGKGAQLSVSAINANTDTLYLTNVQGQEFTNNEDVFYFANNGTRTSVQTGVIKVDGASSVISPLYEGNVFEVQQYSHGMKADNNKVQISDIHPDTVPTPLIDNATITSNTINVGAANTSYFNTYEGITTSFGYVKVGQEIMFYNSIDANGTLGIGTRGIDNTVAQPHDVDALVYKYELNGISLIGINTTHDMPTDSTLSSSKDIDKFYLSAGRSVRNTGDNQVSFTNEKTAGGSNTFVSKNFQYNAILPRFNVLTPGETTGLSAQLRSVSGTSAGGSEVSFIDQGYENVELNQLNRLSSTRIICSEVNELSKLTDLPKNRSTTLAVQLTSQDPNLSPMVDLQNGTLILQRNKLNNPISDYTNDSRSNELSGDPHAAVYISNRIDLKQPASSLKVLVSAFRHSSADFRVLYQLFRPDSSEVEQTYELFPGYNNLKDTDDDGFGDSIIDISLKNGRADAFVKSSKSDEFLEYQFSIDDLESFTGFKIKIVSSGTDEANSPRFKDLRVIALA